MKNPFHQAIAISLAFLFVACSSPASDATNDTPPTAETPAIEAFASIPNYVATAKDTISLGTFTAWKNNWSQHSRAWLDTTSLEYFDMPLVDLTQVVGEEGIAKSRFYMGLKVIKDGYMPKLCLVGIDSSGQLMTDQSKGQYVYDLTRACPPFCND